MNCLQELGITQAVLQTLNVKFKNPKIIITVMVIKVLFFYYVYEFNRQWCAVIRFFYTNITTSNLLMFLIFATVDVIINWDTYSSKNWKKIRALILRYVCINTKTWSMWRFTVNLKLLRPTYVEPPPKASKRCHKIYIYVQSFVGTEFISQTYSRSWLGFYFSGKIFIGVFNLWVLK